MLVVQPLAGFGSGAMFIASEVFIDPRLVTEISTLLGFSPASFGLAVAGSCPLLSSVNKPLLSPLKAFAGISLGFCYTIPTGYPTPGTLFATLGMPGLEPTG